MKLFNKFVSIVTVVAFVLSMMAVPAFAATGVAGFQTATGNEAVKVTYYSDAACETAITTAEPGATVYAKISANVPTKTISDMKVVMALDNVTAIEEVTADLYSSVIGTHFERPALANSASTTSVGIAISKKAEATALHNSPTDYANFIGINGYQYTYFDAEAFDICVYKLTVSSTENAVVKMTKTSGEIGLGVVDDSFAPFAYSMAAKSALAVTDEGITVKSAAQEPVITYSYDATIASTKVDPESATYEDDVKALVTVTKTTKTDDEVTGTETVAAKAMVVDKAAKTVTVTFADDTTKVLNYTEMVIEYGTPAVDLKYPLYDYAVTEDDIAEDVSVTVLKTKDGVVEKLTLVAGTDYDVVVTFDENANSGKAVVTFKGDYAGNTAVTKTFDRTDAPVSYKDVVASISGSPFDFGTTEDEIKAAIAVKGTKVEGVVETANVEVPANLYEITVDLDNGTAVVTMDGTTIDTLTFEISEETFTYSDYAVDYTGAYEYDYTVDADTIAALVKVTATKTGETTPADTVDLTNEVDVVVDKDAGTITVTWKAESAHAGNDIDGAVISITFNDVIKYKNASASLSKTSFADDATDDEIKGFLTVGLDKIVNETKEDGFTADYNVTVDRVNNKVIVTFDDEYGVEDIEIGITFYSASAVTAKVVLDTTTVADGKVTLGNDYVAYIELDGLTSAYGGEFTLSVNKGTIKTVEAATGYTINNEPAENVASTTVEYTKDLSGTATARVLKVTVSTVGTAKDDVVTLKVDSMKVSQVENFNINELPTQTSEAKADVTIDQFVRAMSVALPKLEIGIVTLGTLNDDKYVDGVTLGAVDLTDKVSVDTTNRKLVVDGVVLDGSETEDEVTYTLKVVVPGYTSIEADIVIEYVSDENAADYNTWKIKSNEITTDSKIYAGDVSGADNTITAADYSDIVAVYGDAITTLYDLYEGGDVVDQKDIITMVWAFEQYGMTQVTAAGIIE